MRGRWLLAVALAAGCGGAGGGMPTVDAGPDADARVDHVAKDTTGAPETQAEAGPPGDAPPDLTGDATLDQGRTDGGDAADAHDAADATPDADAQAEVPPDVSSTLCPAGIPTLTVGSTANGTLKGPSNNPAVSCRGGVPTLGPETFFTLTLTAETTVDLLATAPVDTLIAVRPGPCSDTISEIACGENAPQVPADAGADAAPPLPPTDDAGVPLRQTELRVPLAAGTYTIVVDTYTLGTLTSASLTLSASQLTPLPNASCAMPTLITPSMPVMAQPLDLAGAATAVCGGGTQSSLFYTVGVPSGQRLTAKAVPGGGDRAWMPLLEAFQACSSDTCLAQGHLVSGSGQEVDWTNNSSAWQLIFLAVGSDAPVSGAVFDLSVSIVDLFATCNRPMAVMDGTTLTNQDLSLAEPAAGMTCGGSAAHAYYYSATLLPQQSITVNASPSANSNTFIAPNVAIRSGCDALDCLSQGSGSQFTNTSTADMTVLVEITAQQVGFEGPFDLSVSMPPPPAGIVVTPTSGLVTTEAGGTATFTVVLASPPAADVTIALSSSAATEGVPSPTSLTFTSMNWRTPQTVTVTGVDDHVPDGPTQYTIITAPAVSADANYMGLDADDVLCTNLDTDPGVTFTGIEDLVTSEDGSSATFQVTLNAVPTAGVSMTFTSTDLTEGTVSPTQMTFTTTNWNVPQTVTITGVDDMLVDGTQVYKIVTGALTSTDTRYAGQVPPPVTVRNLDDDQPAIPFKVVSGDHSCSDSGTSLPLVVDRANQLYVVMQCEGGLWLTTSTDAGMTFNDPTMIGGTDIFGNNPQIVGGPPGSLYVLFGGNDNNTYFVRTTDGGATWSNRAQIANRQDFMRLAAGEKTVMVLTPGPNGNAENAVARSIDGGRSFLANTFLGGNNVNMTVELDGINVWTVQSGNTTSLLHSTDSGATFMKTADLTQDTSNLLFGNLNFFTISNGTLNIASLADPTNPVSSVTFISQPAVGMAYDDADNVTILDSDTNGHLRATHVILGATPPTDGRALGPMPNAAGLATLSRKAAAVTMLSGNIVLYSTVVW